MVKGSTAGRNRSPVRTVFGRCPVHATLAAMTILFAVTRLRAWWMMVLVLAGLQALAQDPKPRTKVLLYRERVQQQFDTVDCVKNVLKLNPLIFMRGEIPLSYERALTSRLSAQLGVGMTWRNYINFNLGTEEVDDFGEGTTIIPKLSYHVAARYYFTVDVEPQGSYIELEFAHLDYVKDIAKKDSMRQITDEKVRDTRTYNDLRLLFGYQSLSATSNWLFDFYGGIGLRDRRMIIVKEDFNPSTLQYQYSNKEQDDIVPALFLGFRVGLGF